MSRSDGAPDAIVVGAGHNGLVAAILLADAGWDVLVLEATPYTGGALRSAEVTAPGFSSDLFSAFYPLAAASPVIADLGLEDCGLSWSRAPAVLAHVFPDGRHAVLDQDPERTADSVARFAPADRQAWLTLTREWEDLGELFLRALFRPFPPVVPAARLAAHLGLGGSARLARLLTLSARRFGDETFDGEGARMLVAGNAGHADIPVDGAGSAVFGWLLTMCGQTYGFPVPRGGSGKLADALVTRLTRAGGAVRTGAAVERVLVAAGTAVGVQLWDGERIRARRAVLADLNAPELYRRLVGADALPARFLAGLDHFQWDPPTVKLNWALSGPVPWSAPEVTRAGTVHLGVDMDGMTAFAGALARRQVPADPFVLLGQMTTADPSRSPAGTESVWAYTHLPRDVALTDELLGRVVERVEEVVEQQAPGFRARVVGRTVQSPAALAEQNPNLWHGGINGGTAQLHQQAIFRPTFGLGGAATPIDRLFLAGSSAHPGGGVHGGPGSNAALAALVRSGPAGAARRRLTAAAQRRLYG